MFLAVKSELCAPIGGSTLAWNAPQMRQEARTRRFGPSGNLRVIPAPDRAGIAS
jgi:hypothetical protein